MSQTKKSKLFFEENMDNKPVTAIPGVGVACGNVLMGIGIDKATDLYKIFLLCDTNKEKFREWTNKHCCFKSQNFNACFCALQKFHFQFSTQTSKNSGSAMNVSNNTSRGSNVRGNSTSRKTVTYRDELDEEDISMSDSDLSEVDISRHQETDVSQTKKFKTLSDDSMENKPVTDIPGVGQACGKMLMDFGITKASDLYNIFLLCQTNKDKFRTLITKYCPFKTKNFNACFEALQQLHVQFSTEYQLITGPETNNSRPDTSTDNVRDNVKPKITPRFPENLDEQDITVSDFGQVHFSRISGGGNVEKPDPLRSFFVTMFETVTTFPPPVQVQVKSDIFRVINKTEMSLTQEAEPVASTSQTSIEKEENVMSSTPQVLSISSTPQTHPTNEVTMLNLDKISVPPNIVRQ